MIAVGDKVRFVYGMPGPDYATLEVRFINDTGQIFALDNLAGKHIWIELKPQNELCLQGIIDQPFVGLWYRIPG